MFLKCASDFCNELLYVVIFLICFRQSCVESAGVYLPLSKTLGFSIWTPDL